jgi:hypothetical protein
MLFDPSLIENKPAPVDDQEEGRTKTGEVTTRQKSKHYKGIIEELKISNYKLEQQNLQLQFFLKRSS